MIGKCGHTIRQIESDISRFIKIWYCDIDGQVEPYSHNLKKTMLEDFGVLQKTAYSEVQKKFINGERIINNGNINEVNKVEK
jgi:hypothetical protein